LNAFAVADCVPDITFLLDVDLKTAQSRMRQPRRPDRMEQELASFTSSSRRLSGACEMERDRVVVIEGWKLSYDIEKEIWETLVKRFPELAAKSRNQQSQSEI